MVERRGVGKGCVAGTRGALDWKNRRHVALRHRPAGVHDGQPLDDVRELANVPRPRVPRQRGDGLLAPRLDRLTSPHAVKHGEVPHQRGNVSRSLTQRRNWNWYHVETK